MSKSVQEFVYILDISCNEFGAKICPYEMTRLQELSALYKQHRMQIAVGMNTKKSKSTTWVSNPRPANLYNAARATFVIYVYTIRMTQ